MTNLAAKVMGVRKAGKGGIRSLLTDLRAGKVAERRQNLPLLEISLAKGGASGSVAVGLTLARLIFGPHSPDGNIVMQPSDMVLETSAFHAAGSHLFTLATTLPEFNLGIDPFWGEEDAPLRFTHARWPANGLVRAMYGILTNAPAKRMRKRGMESFNIEEALLGYNGDIVLDGEFLSPPPSGKIKITTTDAVVFVR